MSRALLILISEADRAKAKRWIDQSPRMTRVEFKAHKRSSDQNSKMWAMLTEVAEQATHMGQRYTPDQWKILFMFACGREVQFLPGLDGKTFLPWGQSTSDLSKDEMTDLIEFIHAWGAENGVVFHDPQEPQDERPASGCSDVARETETRVSEAEFEETQSEAANDALAEGDGAPSSQTTPSPSPLVECARKLLGIAVDPLFETVQQRRTALEKSKDEWKAILPEDDHRMLRSIVSSADAVIKGDTSHESAVLFFSECLECKEDDLK